MSTTGKILDSTKTINGSYGELFEVTVGVDPDPDTLEFLANIQSFEARATVERKEVMRSGTRRTGYKRGAISGEGTMRGFKVTSKFASRFSDEFDESIAQQTFTFESRLEDPESLGPEVARFFGVQIWEMPLGWSVGDLIEEDVPFTFDDYEIVTAITGDATQTSATTGAPTGV